MTGTAINVGTVLLGSSLGVVLGHRLPERLRETVFAALGLFTLLIGFRMALKTEHVLILLGSTLIGAFLGEGIGIQARLDALGTWLERRLSAGTGRFSEGFVTSSLVFCVGPMTVVGAIQDGLTGNYELLATKSVLDGFASLAFAATFGLGVACSAVTVLVVQGPITFWATRLQEAFPQPLLLEMEAAGGLIIVAVGLSLLGAAQIRVANFLPSLCFAPLIVWVVGKLSL
ncbi:MAG: hypothetical protein CME26_02625 [Gemmatimonadetes bacterium]|nr:hypothetical protein [Gemmatimonadota bacterium]